MRGDTQKKQQPLPQQETKRRQNKHMAKARTIKRGADGAIDGAEDFLATLMSGENSKTKAELIAELKQEKRLRRKSEILQSEFQMKLFVESELAFALKAAIPGALPQEQAIRLLSSVDKIRDDVQQQAAVLHLKSGLGNRMRERLRKLRAAKRDAAKLRAQRLRTKQKSKKTKAQTARWTGSKARALRE